MPVPVIGVMQTGQQAHADRYTYLPHIGLGISATWLAGNRAVTRRRRVIISVIAALTLAGFTAAARLQAAYWHDSFSLWNRALSCTQNNFAAHSNLGAALFVNGHSSEAIRQFEQALRIEPGQAEIYNNLAAACGCRTLPRSGRSCAPGVDSGRGTM